MKIVNIDKKNSPFIVVNKIFKLNKVKFTSLIILIFSVMFILDSCNKDDNLVKLEKNNTKKLEFRSDFILENAKQVFEEKFFSKVINERESILKEIKPLWFLAKEVGVINSGKIVVVPVKIDEKYDELDLGTQLVFYHDENNNDAIDLIVYKSENDPNEPITNNSFTGTILTLSLDEKRSFETYAQNGEIVGVDSLDGVYNIFSDVNEDNLLDFRTKTKCYNWRGSWWGRLWNKVKGFFGSSKGSSGYKSTHNWHLGFWYINNEGKGTGGGSKTKFNNIFDGEFFEGKGGTVLRQLEQLIAENNLLVCTEELHIELYQCFALNMSEEDRIMAGFKPLTGGSSTSSGELSMDAYIRILNYGSAFCSAYDGCINDAVSQYGQSEIDLVAGDGMLYCSVQKINNFDIDDKEFFKKLKEKCGTDDDCIRQTYDCIEDLDSFQSKYNVSLNEVFLSQTVFSDNSDLCVKSGDNFEDEVFEKLTEQYASQTTSTYPSPDNSGFFDRTLSCESFRFINQSSADGQIACVKGLYLSKNYGPAHYNTPDFCGHFTVPRIRYNGEVISAGKAANCSAWAANAAGAVAGIAFSKNIDISDTALKIIFKKAYNLKMKLTNCGYGAMTECEYAECLGSEQQAVWRNGFFDWLGEQFFGCD